MQINRFNEAPLENGNAQQARSQAKPGQRSGLDKAGQQLGATDFAPTDAVKSQAGFKEGVSYRSRSLSQFLSPARQRNADKGAQQASRRTRNKSQEVTDDDELDEDLMAPVMDMLDFLREDSGRQGQSMAEEMLAENFDPVQRYNLLAEALETIDNEAMSMAEKIMLRNAIMEMMSDLYEKYLHELRRALQENDILVNSLETLALDEAGRRMPSTRDLRFLIGAKSKGKEDLPLTPLTMLKALIKNFGAHKCMKVMTGLRSRMMIGF